MNRLKTIQQKEIKKVNSKADLEDIIDVGDKVRINFKNKIYTMVYEGIVDRIYHSFMKINDDKKHIVCWRSEIQHFQYKDGVIIFDNLNRKIELYPLNSMEYKIKQKMLD